MNPTESPQTAPPRRNGKKRWRRLIGPVGLVALALAGWFGFGLLRGAEPADGTKFVVQEVGRGTIRKTVSASGILQPWTVVDIKSKAGGRVDRLAVELGDRVAQGQVIATIDPSDSALQVNTARADTASAAAREAQNGATYRLQVRQSGIAVESAEASLASARANLSAAEARYRTAADQALSQPAQTGSVIRQAEAALQAARQSGAQLDSSQANERANTRASLDQARANFTAAEADAVRQRQLFEKGYVAGSVAEKAEATLGVASAQVRAAEERDRTLEGEQRAARQAQDARIVQAEAALANARAQTDVKNRVNAVSEARSAVAQANAQVLQARASVNQAIADRANNEIKGYDIAAARASTARARATLDNAQDTLAQTTVRAPSAGVVLQKYVEQGTIITSGMSMNSTGTAIVQLGDVSRMYVSVTVDETDIASVQEGQSVEVSVEAYPEETFSGKVARISPQAAVEQNVTTVAVRVEIDNAAPTFRHLKPNMNATCEFVVEERRDVVVVPTEAVRADDQGAFVQIAVGGKPVAGAAPGTLTGVKVERRSVTTGIEGEDTVEIVTGLQPGERFVAQSSTGAGAATQTSGSPFGGGMGGPPGGGPPPGPPPGGG